MGTGFGRSCTERAALQRRSARSQGMLPSQLRRGAHSVLLTTACSLSAQEEAALASEGLEKRRKAHTAEPAGLG